MKQDDGMRFIFRNGEYIFKHKNELLPTDIDCSDMDDLEFEEFVLEHTS
ncbi:MAG: hypothetical protein WC829_15310 [Hyphomicrobium sp.]|jgi:hypothetical protein